MGSFLNCAPGPDPKVTWSMIPAHNISEVCSVFYFCTTVILNLFYYLISVHVLSLSSKKRNLLKLILVGS